MIYLADGKVIIDSELNDKGLEKGLSDLQGKLESTGKKLQSVGGGLTKGVTLPLLAIGAGAIAVGKEYEASMSSVAAISGATGDDLDALKSIAREMGATTKFSASEAANGLEYMALAGWETEEMTSALPGVLNLASAGSLDLGRASDLVTDSMSAMGLEVQDLDGYLNKVASAASNANTDIDALMEANVIAGGTFKRMNTPIAESNAMLGVMANRGTKGAEAGTALNAIMGRLMNSTGPAAEALEEMGVNAYDAEGNFRGMETVLKEVEDAMYGTTDGMANMTDQQIADNLAKLAGVNHGKTFEKMLGGLGDEYDELKNDIENSDGALEKMKDTMEDNMDGALANMMSAISEVALSFYDMAGGPITTLIQKVTGVITWFGKLSDETKQWIMIVAGIAAALGPVLVVIGTLITAVSKIAGAFALISPPVMIAIGVFAAIIAIGVKLYQNWDTIKEKAIQVFSNFSPLLDTVRGAFQTLMDSVGPIIESLKTLWQSLLPIIEMLAVVVGGVLVTAFGVVVATFTAVISALGPLINAFVNFADFIVNMVNVVVALFTGDFSGAFDYWMQAGQSAIDMFVNLFTGVVEFVSGFVTSIIDFFQGLYMTLVGNSIIPDMINAIVEWFTNMVQWVVDLVTGFVDLVIAGFNMLLTGISTVMNGIWSVIVAVWNGIISTITGVVNGIRSVVTSVFNAVRSVITSVMNGVRSTISSVWNGISSTIGSVTSSIRSTISNIFNSLRGIVTGAMSGVRNAVSSGIRGALSAVTGMIGSFRDAGSNIVGSIADGITGAISKVTDAMKNVASKVRDMLPFSPAKDGPLQDLDKLDFGGPIGDSLDDAIPDVQAQMNTLLKVPSFEYSGSKKSNQENKNTTVYKEDPEVKKLLQKLVDKEGNVYLGKEKVGSTMDKEQARRTVLAEMGVALD